MNIKTFIFPEIVVEIPVPNKSFTKLIFYNIIFSTLYFKKYNVVI